MQTAAFGILQTYWRFAGSIWSEAVKQAAEQIHQADWQVDVSCGHHFAAVASDKGNAWIHKPLKQSMNLQYAQGVSRQWQLVQVIGQVATVFPCTMLSGIWQSTHVFAANWLDQDHTKSRMLLYINRLLDTLRYLLALQNPIRQEVDL